MLSINEFVDASVQIVICYFQRKRQMLLKLKKRENVEFCTLFQQVVARQQQQRLLAQQTNNQTLDSKMLTPKTDAKSISRLNGARQLFSDNDTGDSSVSSTTQIINSTKGRREPPQPPPPPLAPLSNTNRMKNMKIENEDSDSTGNNSLASSTGLGNIGLGGISSTEDGDNSLTSFEGLLNGMPNVDNPLCLNEDSNSKESLKGISTNSIARNKPLMLADLLEKKIEKDLPLLNGAITKELRIGDKGKMFCGSYAKQKVYSVTLFIFPGQF